MTVSCDHKTCVLVKSVGVHHRIFAPPELEPSTVRRESERNVEMRHGVMRHDLEHIAMLFIGGGDKRKKLK